MRFFALTASFGSAVLLAGLTASIEPVSAAADVSFKGKSITLIIGSRPGGSTDASARLLAPFFAKYLPGRPSLIVSNRPGAKGLKAQNYFAQQVKPNGLTFLVASGSQVDPVNYRVRQSKYDPTTYTLIGGLDIGGTFLIVRKDQLAALTDKSKPPVAMGSVTGMPRSGMTMTAWGIEYLGWNAKWISGYRGTSSLRLALERGEIGMTSFANQALRPELLDRDKYVITYQSGTHGATKPATMDAIAKVPLFARAVAPKIKSDVGKKAFEYWRAMSSVIKWAALPPKTPDGIAKAYRAAFAKTVADPEFKKRSKRMNEQVTIILAATLVKKLQALAALPPEALQYTREMLNRQGLKIVPRKKRKKKKR
ncbi:MAG: hypothetical protein O7A66_12165 [Alphaproteobacteria bacterium]|nr:hypothetical protein [Alphaproteobacteria bacterium]